MGAIGKKFPWHNETMQGMEEAHLQRLEKESGRFTNEIKQKELENEQLRCEIAKIQSQIKESKEKYDEISNVSEMPGLYSL